MAFKIQSKNVKKRQVVSDINITPFVDVLLVLLIIFMVAAPMMNSSVNVDLPAGSNKSTNDKNHSITVSVKSDGTIFLEEESVKLGFLAKKILENSQNNLDDKVQIRADKNLDYGRVMEVVKTLSNAGFQQVTLVTEMSDG